MTLRGYKVSLYKNPATMSKIQKVYETKEISYKGALGEGRIRVDDVTGDMASAVRGAKYILVMVAAIAHNSVARELAAHVEPGQIVFVLPGTFGALTFHQELKALGKDNIVAETHTLPYAVRLSGEGEVTVMSRFNPLKLGVIPATKTDVAAAAFSELYDGVEPVESVVACGLSSLNPIIHVPGCVLNAGRIEYAGQPFFYYTEGFSDCVVRTTIQLDDERRALLSAFGYASDIVAHGVGKSDDLKEAVAGNPSFARISVPPSFKYRYFTEDIPFGIAVWAKLAHQIGVSVPIMDAMVTLGSCIMNSWFLPIQGKYKTTTQKNMISVGKRQKRKHVVQHILRFLLRREQTPTGLCQRERKGTVAVLLLMELALSA